MPSHCKFTLSNNNETYYAGRDKVEGSVVLITTTDKKVNEIKLRFKGVSKCAFPQMAKVADDENGGSKPGPSYKSKEQFTKMEIVLHESGSFPAGTYTWPFSFFVDGECPTSMESASGHIRYQLSLKVYNREKYKNIFIKPITVIRADDLNIAPYTILPVATDINSITCCGISQTPPRINIRTDLFGYTSGQWIKYFVDVFSKARGKQYALEILFIKHTKYTADSPKKIISIDEKVIHHQEKADNNQVNQTIQNRFFIEPTPPSTKTENITVKYILRATLKSLGCPCAAQAELLVPIGTVPVRGSLDKQRAQAQEAGILPTYESAGERDSTFIDEATPEINRNDTFKPKYPSYQLVLAQ